MATLHRPSLGCLFKGSTGISRHCNRPVGPVRFAATEIESEVLPESSRNRLTTNRR